MTTPTPPATEPLTAQLRAEAEEDLHILRGQSQAFVLELLRDAFAAECHHALVYKRRGDEEGMASCCRRVAVLKLAERIVETEWAR